MAHRAMTRYLGFMAFGALLMTAACTADEQEKLGYDGEFCAKDADCREAHICQRGACVETATPQRDECDALCGKLTSCGRAEQDCSDRCVQTLIGWSEVALEAFSACTLNELTCEAAQDGQAAANFCYRKIPLDPARQARCDAFDAAARTFDPDNEAQLSLLFDKCYRLARTGEESNWSRTNACQLLIDAGDPADEVRKCLNRVFVLDFRLAVTNGPEPEPAVGGGAP